MTAELRRPRLARLHALAAALALACAAHAPQALAAAATTTTTVQSTTTTTPAGTTTKKTVAKTTHRRTRGQARRASSRRHAAEAAGAPPVAKTETVTTQTEVAKTPDGKTTTETKTTSRTVVIEHKAGDILSQPARDVGISKLKIPPVLVKARDAPYDLTGLNTCEQLADAVAELSTVLGPDFIAGEAWRENRAGKLVEAGGRAVVNSLIPYRGLVREVTGAAPQQRRLDDAVSAGFARRGFLRGLHEGRRCKNAFAADIARENKAIR